LLSGGRNLREGDSVSDLDLEVEIKRGLAPNELSKSLDHHFLETGGEGEWILGNAAYHCMEYL